MTFQQKYVRTEKFVREREARRALIGTDFPTRHLSPTLGERAIDKYFQLGKYRNKFTDAVEFTVRSTANTNVVSFNNQLLALKEDSPPYAMDPETLETKGLYTFDGQLPSVTFTAHPKTDPVTGELICFGYEAKGDGSPDICYYTIGPDGKFTQTVWLVSPVCGMIHDFAVTENWVSAALLCPLWHDVGI